MAAEYAAGLPHEKMPPPRVLRLLFERLGTTYIKLGQVCQVRWFLNDQRRLLIIDVCCASLSSCSAFGLHNAVDVRWLSMQFIASSPTIFPAEYVEEMQACLDSAPPVPWATIR